jgi:hypothetical protein
MNNFRIGQEVVCVMVDHALIKLHEIYTVLGFEKCKKCGDIGVVVSLEIHDDLECDCGDTSDPVGHASHRPECFRPLSSLPNELIEELNSVSV